MRMRKAKRAIRRLLRRLKPKRLVRLWVPAGHFYSPIVDPADRHVRRILLDSETADLPEDSGVELDDELILGTLDRIAAFYSEAPFSDEKQPGLRYYYRNRAYETGDGIIYYGMLRSIKPKRVIEVGSGFSSALLMDVNDKYFDRSTEVHFIEPYPDRLKELIAGDKYYRLRLIESKLQDVPTMIFRLLQAGDILFIDSSHVAKLGSDVNDYMFRILPALAPGVYVHIHDIAYPFEYPALWTWEENRSWNEAYLLRAFLEYNRAFKVVYFSHYVHRKYKDILEQKMPMCVEDSGASIWLLKTQL